MANAYMCQFLWTLSSLMSCYRLCLIIFGNQPNTSWHAKQYWNQMYLFYAHTIFSLTSPTDSRSPTVMSSDDKRVVLLHPLTFSVVSHRLAGCCSSQSALVGTVSSYTDEKYEMGQRTVQVAVTRERWWCTVKAAGNVALHQFKLPLFGYHFVRQTLYLLWFDLCIICPSCALFHSGSWQQLM